MSGAGQWEVLEADCRQQLAQKLQAVGGGDPNHAATLQEISELHARLRSQPATGEVADEVYLKLRKLYQRAIANSRDELSVCIAANQTLGRLIDLREKIEDVARARLECSDLALSVPKRHSSILSALDVSLPRWKGKGKLPALCGRVPAALDYTVPVGHQVAALTLHSEEAEEVWLLATVVHYESSMGQYEVEDILAEEPAGDDAVEVVVNKHYVLPKSSLIPLPLWEPPYDNHSAGFHPVGAKVLALYPQTTCFYLGTVSSMPNKRRSEYLIEFKDDEDVDGLIPQRKVAQRYVLSPL